MPKEGLFNVWRLIPQRTEWDPWDGEGARLFGGRWNPRGVPMVYASSTMALAMLEILVHLRGLTETRDYWAYPMVIEESYSRRLDPEALPDHSESEEPVAALQDIGKAWVDSDSSPALAVPSAIIPHEYNYLINPKHPDFEKLAQGEPVAITVDPRLLG
mgnify:CR=1 FL=1